MFNLTIYCTGLSLSVLEPWSTSQWLFLEKRFHRSSALIYYPISIYFHTSIGYDNTANKFAFQFDRAKVTGWRGLLILKS